MSPALDVLHRRPVQAGLVVAALALGAWWTLGGSREPEIVWVDVERDDLVLGVEVEGTLAAVDTSSLGPPQVPWIWEYKIAMLAPEGETVRKGQPVLAFDASELQVRLQEKEAEAEEARKEIEKKEAELALQRQQDILRLTEAEARYRKAKLKVDVPGELASDNDLETARLDLELAEKEIAFVRNRLEGAERSGAAALRSLRSQKERAEERVREIRAAIDSMTVKAPRDGTVVYASNWRGEKKKVGDGCWRGEVVLEIPDLDEMKADGEVDEADASRIRVGQRLELRLDAHPDDTFAGTVSHIWSTVQQKSWRNPLKIVRLDIELDRTDQRRMRPGMRFRGRIETERIEDAVVVPAEAVFVKDDVPVVFRKTLLGYEAVPVTLGRRNESRVEVLDGLEPGDRISRTDPSAAEASSA